MGSRFNALKKNSEVRIKTLVRPWRLPLGDDSLPLLYETLRERYQSGIQRKVRSWGLPRRRMRVKPSA